MKRKSDFLGYEVFTGSRAGCLEDIGDHFGEAVPGFRWLACLNPHSYAVAKNDSAFSDALSDADWLVPDGVGIVLAGRLIGIPFFERITGFDIFDGVMRDLNDLGGRVFFLGSSHENLSLVEARVGADYPNVVFAGKYSPPFRNEFSVEENEAMLSAVISAKPDVLWVGMTAPKQEKWLFENRERLPVVFAGAIGAVFDFYSGKVKRSHPFFQRLGLEWLPRLVKQPRRLWRRMGVSAPLFIRDVFLDWFGWSKR